MSTHIDSREGFASRLREARLRAGLSQRDLAFPGCSPAYVSRLEAGDRTPSLQVLRELARRLGLSEQYLATGDERGAPEGRSPEDRKLLDADVALRLDELELAEQLYGEVLEQAAATEDRARALAGLGQLAFRRGEPWTALDHLQQALGVGGWNPADQPAVADTLGRAYAMVGELERSADLFRDCLSAAEERGDVTEVVRFAVLLAHALEDLGELEEADALLTRMAPLVEETQNPVLRARLYWSRSRLHTMENDPAPAAYYARKALEILELTEHAHWTGRAHQLLAHIELDRGRPEEALELLRRGRPMLASTANPVEHAQFRLEEARALAALGRAEEAATLAMEIAPLVAEADPFDAARAYTVLGDVVRQLGERARARELYELAVELLERNPTRYLAEVYARLAELLEEEGRKDEALTLLKKAVRVPARPRGRVA